MEHPTANSHLYYNPLYCVQYDGQGKGKGKYISRLNLK